MSYGKTIARLGILLVPCIAVGFVAAQERPGARTDRDALPQPVYKVATKLTGEGAAAAETPQQAQGQLGAGQEQGQAVPGQHPLQPALDLAFKCLQNIQANVKDYSATMYKRERIDGKLADPEVMYIKIRHEPFSAYTYFKSPESLKGQEAIYVAGKNDGNLQGHGVGIKKLIGMVQLKPDSMMAMRGNRYPITEIGILNLTKRLIEVAQQDMQYGECDVQFRKGSKINKRPAICIEVTHPVPRKNFRFHKARVFVDEELNVPIRYEAYDWPATAGGPPQLLEEYTYVDLKINNGFTDADFDDKNPNYAFH